MKQVIVLGMHRSGTSLITNLLAKAGCYIGEANELLPAKTENPLGFWERLDVFDINEKLLSSAGTDWISANQFTLKKISSDTDKALATQAKVVINTLNQHTPWAIKDPRLCFTLPFWQRYLTDPVIVMCVRSPIEVARSLQVRNTIPTVIGCALWEVYTKSLIQHSKTFPSIVVDYARLVNAPEQETNRLLKWLTKQNIDGLHPLDTQTTLGIVNPNLYRQRHKDMRCRSTKEQSVLYATLKEGQIPSSITPSSFSQDILALFNYLRKLNHLKQKQAC